MSQEKYIGMDVHQASISVAVRDAKGKLVVECVLETKADTILGFHSRTTWNLGADFRGGDLSSLVTRSAATPCQSAGGLRSAHERSVKGWQQERSGGCAQAGGVVTHPPGQAGVPREAWNTCLKGVGAKLLDHHQRCHPVDESDQIRVPASPAVAGPWREMLQASRFGVQTRRCHSHPCPLGRDAAHPVDRS